MCVFSLNLGLEAQVLGLGLKTQVLGFGLDGQVLGFGLGVGASSCMYNRQ